MISVVWSLDYFFNIDNNRIVNVLSQEFFRSGINKKIPLERGIYEENKDFKTINIKAVLTF